MLAVVVFPWEYDNDQELHINIAQTLDSVNSELIPDFEQIDNR